MSEPAGVLPSKSNALAGESDRYAKKENFKIVDLEKGFKFLKGQYFVRVANSGVLRQKAYELVYELYSKKGFTRDLGADLWLSIYDALPDTTTFVVENNKGCIEGTLTAVFDSAIGLPADELYQKEIDGVRNSSAKICEIVSLGTKNTDKKTLKILACLFYCVYVLAWRIRKATDFVITVNPSHKNFYCRKLLFKEIGPKRNYAKVNGAPSVLLNVPLCLYGRPENKHRIFPIYMTNHSNIEELNLIKKMENSLSPISDREFYTFFIEKTDIWQQCSQQQKDFIKKIYPVSEANHYEISRALASGFSKSKGHSDHTLNEIKRAI
jgi:hypothetical protein